MGVEVGSMSVGDGDEGVVGDEGEETTVIEVDAISEGDESEGAMVEGNVKTEGGENLKEASAATDGRVCFKIILSLFLLSSVCAPHPLVSRTRGVGGGRVVQAWFTDHPWLFPSRHHQR